MHRLGGLILGLGMVCSGAAVPADVISPVSSAGCEGASGIGADERESIALAAVPHNLRLTFATKGSGEYQADVAVMLSDQNGNPIASFTSPGPLCALNLRPGRYRIAATAHGETLQRHVDLRRRGVHEVYFYWPQ